MTHTPIEREEPPRELTALPVRLALIDAGLSAPAACLGHLSHDLLEALDAYERHLPLPAYGAARAIESHTYLLSPANGDVKRMWGELREQSLRDEQADLPRRALLYGLACTDDHDSATARTALYELGAACDSAGIPWGGGVAVTGGRLVVASSNGPRMGRMRRRRSEAIDMLIVAIRSGCSVKALPDQNSSDLIIAPCPVPRPLYEITCDLLEHRI